MQTDTRSEPFQDEEMHEVARRAGDIAANIASVILGKEEVIQACVVALLAGGHLIIEDYPGVGKTMLAKTWRSVNCEFARIQFTPDLLPSDVTGVSVYNQKTGGFEFRRGPIIAKIVLADEINRGHTQDAVRPPGMHGGAPGHGGQRDASHRRALLVLATQNPIEYEGTYPLPEAQLDRFMLRMSLGYRRATPRMRSCRRRPRGTRSPSSLPSWVTVRCSPCRRLSTGRQVAPAIRRYVVDILAATRGSRDVYLGASPRAGIALVRAAKALAVLRGRDFVVPQDIKDLAGRVLSHRIILSPDAKVHGQSEEAAIGGLLKAVPVPGPER